jgi:filamentous hemagglutinin family protein
MRKSEPKYSRRLNRLAVSLLVGLWAVTPVWVNALPSGGKIVPQAGTITQSKQDMVIKQNNQRLIIDWQKFSIGSKESVTFEQPSSSAVALNRVIGVDPSRIYGRLSANGQVFLSNPSGVVFGKNAVVDVHGILATTLNISDKDFLNGNYQFSQDPNQSLAAIINKGVIKAGSYVGLVAPAVENSGSIIVADLGSVALASGTAATLDFNGDGLISFAVSQEVLGDVYDANGKKVKDRINNSGLIRANGGQVLLTAKSAGKLIGDVVNHSGIIEAQTVQQKDGKIILSSGDTGTVEVSGTLDAPNVFITADTVAVAANKALSTNNGNMNILADHLDIKGDLDSGTGDFLFTLANGGDLNIGPGNNPNGGLGSNDIRHIIAENLILKTDGKINVKGITERNTAGIKDSVILNSGGDINFEDVISLFPALRLFAANDINVNTDVTTTQGDFVAVADSDNNGKGDFNVAPGVVISSARDIDVSAVNINANQSSFNGAGKLILNSSGAGGGGSRPSINTNSVQQASLSSFLTDFFQNGGSGDDC